jgi:hypothetical protein
MSNTNDTSKLAPLDRPLADSELDAVSGGAFPFVHVQVAMLNQCLADVENAALTGLGPGGECYIPPGMKG